MTWRPDAIKYRQADLCVISGSLSKSTSARAATNADRAMPGVKDDNNEQATAPDVSEYAAKFLLRPDYAKSESFAERAKGCNAI